MTAKFRVWCRDYNQWEKDRMYLSEDGVAHHFFRFDGSRRGDLMAVKPSNHIVQFFTGLLDKNGKEIYEGDIIKIDYRDEETIREIVFCNGYFAYERLDPKYSGAVLHGINRISEVIGNIFQNPELLKS